MGSIAGLRKWEFHQQSGVDVCTHLPSVLPSWEPDAPRGHSRAQSGLGTLDCSKSGSGAPGVGPALRGGSSTYHLPTAAFVSLGPLQSTGGGCH